MAPRSPSSEDVALSPRLFRPLRLLFAGAFLLGLTGCYTQLVTVQPYADEPDYVEVEEYGDSTVVSKYYYEDQGGYYDDYGYYDAHHPYPYNRYFNRFYVGVTVDPFCWDPFYYYDPFCYSHYDPFFYSHYDPFYGGSWYSPYNRYYYPGYVYVYAPYYGGFRWDAPYARRGRDYYEPRGSTMGRRSLADIRTRTGPPRGTMGRTYDTSEDRWTRGRTVTRTGAPGYGRTTTARDRGTVTRSYPRSTSRGTSVDRSTGSSSRDRGTVTRSYPRSTSRGSVGRSSSGSSRGSSGSVGRSSSGSSRGSSGSVGRSSSGSSRGSSSSGSVGRSSSSRGSSSNGSSGRRRGNNNED